MRLARWLGLGLSTTLLLASTALAERVTFQTSDGVTIVGDLYLKSDKAATVVCLPMYRNVRSTWNPLIEPLKNQGFNVLALDLRGHGDSGESLASRVRGRDPKVFNAMWKDVVGAVSFLESRGLDVSRLGLIGASVGCSVAIDAVVQNPGPFRSVIVLTPGANYLGVDTLEDARTWPGIPLWILTSDEEESRVVPVAKAFEAWPNTKFTVVPGSGIHGTRMFGKVRGIEGKIVARFKETLAERPHLCIPRFAAGDPRTESAGLVRHTLRVSRQRDGVTYTLMSFAVGDQVTFGAMVKGEFRGTVRLTVGKAEIALPFRTDRVPNGRIAAAVKRGPDAKVFGEQASFRGTHWITVELPASDWLSGPQAHPAALCFSPETGREMRLPEDGRFVASLVEVRSEN